MGKIILIISIFSMVVTNIEGFPLFCFPFENIGERNIKTFAKEESINIYPGCLHINIPNDSLNITDGDICDITIDLVLPDGVCVLDLSQPGITLLNITLPKLAIKSTNYTIKTCDVGGLFAIWGNGTLDLSFLDISISFNIIGNITNDTYCLMVNPLLKTEGCEANITNLMDGDIELNDILNKVVADLGPEILQTIWQSIWQNLDPKLMKIIETLLRPGSHQIHNILERVQLAKNSDEVTNQKKDSSCLFYVPFGSQ